MSLNNLIIVILTLFIFTSCAKTVKKPKPENFYVYNPPTEAKVTSFFTPINSTDSNILNACNKIKIDLFFKRKAQIEITDPNSLSTLLLLINGAESTDDHKCSSIARLKIISGESEVLIELLPGHKDEFYEFRYGKSIYKINRNKFIEINEIKEYKEELLSVGK